MKEVDDDKIFVGIYVDDILTTGNNKSRIEEFRSQLKNKFRCSEGGTLTGCLGIEVRQSENKIELTQEKYLTRKLQEFDKWLLPNVKRSTPSIHSFKNY